MSWDVLCAGKKLIIQDARFYRQKKTDVAFFKKNATRPALGITSESIARKEQRRLRTGNGSPRVSEGMRMNEQALLIVHMC